MTYGSWLAQARQDLHVAAAWITGNRSPDGFGDALACLAARRAAFHALARHVELLAGKPATQDPVSAGRDAARPHSEADSPADRLWLGLSAAVNYAPGLHSKPQTPGVQALAQAADAIAIAADILAGHVQPGGRSRTAEGAAIRAGGGVAAALADIARVTLDLIAVDDSLVQRLRPASPIISGIATRPADRNQDPHAADVRHAAQQIVTDNADAVALLHHLHAARATGQPPRGATNAEEAAADFLAARDWLWQHHDQFHGVHLRAGTRLGLAVCTLAAQATRDGDRVVGHWRSAVVATTDLFGSPPTGEAAHCAKALGGVLRWATDLLTRGTADPFTAEERTTAHRLAAKLPILASALAAGIPSAVRRGELLVRAARLESTRAGVRRATPTYHRAAMTHPTVSALRRALQTVEPPRITTALAELEPASHVRRAFPHPPRPSATEPAPRIGSRAPTTGPILQRRAR